MSKQKYKRALIFALIISMALFLGLPSKTQALFDMWDTYFFRNDIVIQGAIYPVGPIIHGVPGGMPIVVGDHFEVHGEISRPFGPVIINDSLLVKDWSVFEGDIDFKEGITVDFTRVNVLGLAQGGLDTSANYVWTGTHTFNQPIAVSGVAGGTWQGNAIAEAYGGTDQTTYTTGDLLYASGVNTLAKLGIGLAGEVLQVSGGVPTWQTIGTVPAPGTQGAILYDNGSNWVALGPGTSGQFLQTQGAGANPVWATAGGAGDITAVGDVASGDAFTETAGNDGNSLWFEGSTADANEIKLTAQDPGADYTITLPAQSGTVALTSDITDYHYLGGGDTNFSSWVTINRTVYNADDFPNRTFSYAVVYTSASAGLVADVRLYDFTNSSVISGSTISGMTGSGPTKYSSGSLTMPSGEIIMELQLQRAGSGSAKSFIQGARIRAVR